MDRYRSPALLAALCLWAACTSTTDLEVNPNQVTATIGAAGGTLVSHDSSVTVTIPAGALAGPTDISITPVDPGDLPAQFVGLDVAAAYDLGPDGATFAMPVTVTVRSEQLVVQTDSSLEFTPEQLLTLGADTIEALDSVGVEMRGDTMVVAGQIRHFSPVVRVRRQGKVIATLSGVPDEWEVGPEFTASLQVVWNEAPPPGVTNSAYWSSASVSPIGLAFTSAGSGYLTSISATVFRDSVRYVCTTSGLGLVRIRVELYQRVMVETFRVNKSVDCLPPLPKRLTVVLQGSGSGTVTGNPAGIACPQDCDELFPHGTGVLLTATPAAGSAFDHFAGACAGTAPATAVTMDRDQTCIVEFTALPTVSDIQPSRVTVGGPSFQLTVTGQHFIPNRSAIGFGSITLPTSFVSTQQLTATVPASEIAAIGSKDVTVTTQGAGTSAPVPFEVRNPVPSISQLNPATAVAGGPAFTLEVVGADFASGAVVHFGGVALTTQAGSPPDAKLTAAVPAALMATAGTVPVTVVNPGPGGPTSGPVMFDVAPPPPSAKRLSVLLWGNGSGTVTSSPAGIVCPPDCEELFAHGTPVVLTATPAAGSVFDHYWGFCFNQQPVTTVTMDQDLSCTAEFNAPPIVSGIQPSVATVGGLPFQLTVTGQFFIQNRSAISFGSTALLTTFVSDQQLTATVPASEITAAGTRDVTVTTPGIGASAPVVFEVRNPVPSLSQLNPATAVAGGPAFTLDVTGADFASGAVVHFGGVALTTTPGSPAGGKLSAAVPAALIANPGSVPVTVVNPGPGSPTSVSFDFTILPAASDPCTTPSVLQYGVLLNGSLGPGDCTITFGSNREYFDVFTVTTTQQASTLRLTGTPQAYAVIGSATVDFADVFSFGTEASALVFLATDAHFVVVGSNTGLDPQRTYSLVVEPAASTDLANCRTAFARPGVTLTQTLAATDCFGNNRFDPGAGITRYDYVNLNLGSGESATITMSSSAFDPVVMAICTNGVGQTRTFIDDNSGGGTTARLAIGSANDEQCRVEMTSRGDNRGPIVGAYTASITSP